MPKAADAPHVLVVNDDEAMLAVVGELLEEEGYRVTTQRAAARDLDAIAALAPDAMVLDYMWADEDTNWTMLQLLRVDPRTAAIPLVLCTGAAHHVDPLRAKLAELGVRVVLKPFDLEELLGALAEALADGARPHRADERATGRPGRDGRRG